MPDPHPDRLERLIITAARHLPHRPDIREHEWLSMYDECDTRDAQRRLAATCLLLGSFGLLRGFTLKLARVAALLILLALPGVLNKLVADPGAALAIGIVLLLLLPSFQRRPFDGAWYPTLTWPTWVWRASAGAWALLLLSGALVSRDLPFAVACAGAMLLLYGHDLDRVTARRPAKA